MVALFRLAQLFNLYLICIEIIILMHWTYYTSSKIIWWNIDQI
ncbi:hypothetical protein QWZ13_06940 [Reinekea marina]|nr:hypothetical protein [Reinekea marina]MDN3648647.1 hypothetical protein [Reinekea marina]